MIEIRYGENNGKAELAGHSVSKARELFSGELGIPGKAKARLNGKRIKGNLEEETYLCDEDRLSFVEAKGKGLFLVGAMLLALAATGGVFAFGWVNATTQLGANVVEEDFASVSENTGGTFNWSGWGFYKGQTNTTPQPIFDVDTATSQYTGDLVVTVSIANAGDLSKVYRVLGLQLQMTYPNGGIVDINGDSANDSATDVALLTLRNGSVDMFYGGTENICTVKVKSGFFITNIVGSGWGTFSDDPVLYAEVAQR